MRKGNGNERKEEKKKKRKKGEKTKYFGHEVLVPVLEVVDSHVRVSGDDVAAVVEDVVWVAEEGGITGEQSLVVEHDTVGLKVVGSTIDVGTRANTTRGLLDESEVGGEP